MALSSRRCVHVEPTNCHPYQWCVVTGRNWQSALIWVPTKCIYMILHGIYCLLYYYIYIYVYSFFFFFSDVFKPTASCFNIEKTLLLIT